MTLWMTFWKFFFVITLSLFAVMSVWVTIGGFADIKKLFRKMEEARNEQEDE